MCTGLKSQLFWDTLCNKKKKEENNYSGQRIVYLQWDSISFSIQNTINEVKKRLQISLSRIPWQYLKNFFSENLPCKIFSIKRGCWISERHDFNECTSNAGNKPDFPRVRIWNKPWEKRNISFGFIQILMPPTDVIIRTVR